MKKLFKKIFLFIFPVFLISFFIFSYKVVSLDFKFGHQTSLVYQKPFPWQKYLVLSELKKFKSKIFLNENFENIERINFYINEQDQRKLLRNTPNSTKEWVNAQILKPNSKLQQIQLRYRGDNPANWLKFKKTFRIKTKKNELIDGFRRFDFYTLKAEQFFPYIISEKMNLINQSAKLYEVYINGESHGLYVRHEKMDELFLRKNKIMPVNLYKGSNNNVAAHIGLNQNLFNNAEMWTKLAIFNQQELKDKSDLEKFFFSLNSNKLDASLNGYIDIDYFSRFEAFLTLTQNDHHWWKDNMRLIVDPWNGYVTQILTDPLTRKYENFYIDFAANDLSAYLNKNTEFIHKKYNWLYYYIKQKNIFNDISIYVENLNSDLSKADKKEPYDTRLNIKDSFALEVQSLKKNSEKILDILTSNPKSTWGERNHGFQMIVEDLTPVSDLQLEFGNNKPEWIGIDLNYDGKITNNEPKFFSETQNKIFTLPITFYANRVKKTQNHSFIDHDLEINFGKTQLNLISSNSNSPLKIKSKNIFTKKNFLVKKDNKSLGAHINQRNQIIFEEKKVKENLIILDGEILVENDLIFQERVLINPGTIFKIKPGKNIIFKNNLIAEGTKEKPIIFKKFEGEKNWGTIAIMGKESKNSIISHATFHDGSGGYHNQYKFISMFSLHNTKNINIHDCEFSSNLDYDDTVHIIYSDNINFKNIKIFKALSDAIDIDISNKITIENILIESPGNDGIDFMESEGKIINANINFSKDKAISVGENSRVEIFESKLENNNIGIAAKDASFVKIHNSIINNNKTQIAAYAKNWRYGKGGEINVINSKIIAKQNNFNTSFDPGTNEDKNNKDLVQNSKIKMFNTEIQGLTKTEGKIFFDK